jgi:hypothetical protein
VDRAAPDADAVSGSRRVLVTTADATRLVPYVAIAPEGFLLRHPEAVRAWAGAWLEGVEAMQSDVPGAARKVAAVKGAPEPLALLKHLGQVDFAGVASNARVAGLAGRGAVTVEALFARTWNLWREVGVLSTPVPEAAPLATSAITALVLRGQGDPAGAAAAASEAAGKPNFRTRPILRITVREEDDEGAGVRALGLAAGVFSRSALRVGVDRDESKSRQLVQQASERYDLSAVRMQTSPRLAPRRATVIEILAAP